MGAKRALIVDDSKSARLFLARALEKYDIDVDAAETAEAAIAYLSGNRPDVIFMDHMMPGMDGLQAVQVIKNDPSTATIPIMMYTSQEGELYLGQARALGAVGVLPKQIKPTDVSKVLYQLHLLPDRRSPEQVSFTPVNVHMEGVQVSAGVLSKPLTDSALREHFAELRRALVAGVDTQTDRITAEIRALLLESLPPAQPPPRARAPWPWIVACAALAIALISSALWWRTQSSLAALSVQLDELAAAVAAPAAAPVSASAATPADTSAAPPPSARSGVPSDGHPMLLAVPYGSEALGGARLEAVRTLLYRLARQKVTGMVDIRSFSGRFCLVGNALDGYSLAPEETPFSKCDLIGNPAEDALSSAQRTPLPLANTIGEIRSATHGALQVQVAAGDAGTVVMAYPTVEGSLTAGDWNRAAAANNRLEIRVH